MTYDDVADAMYVPVAEAPVYESEEVRPGVVIDYDAEGRIVGFEILNASQLVAKSALVSPRPRSAVA